MTKNSEKAGSRRHSISLSIVALNRSNEAKTALLSGASVTLRNNSAIAHVSRETCAMIDVSNETKVKRGDGEVTWVILTLSALIHSRRPKL